MSLSHALNKIQQKRLPVALGIFFVIFILTRIPFYFHYGIPNIFYDSGDFNNLAQQWIFGNPNFGRRTPFYPIFLAGAWFIWNDILIISVLQSLFAVISGSFVIMTFYRYFTRYTILSGIAITIFTSLTVYLNFESVMMSESLYVSMTLIWVCTLIYAIKRRTPYWWAISSTLLMTVILIRPSGLFLIPLSVIIIVYMIINKYSSKAILFFIIPAAFLYFGVCTYNLIKINRFSISSQGTDMIGNVIPYLEKDNAYPDYVNKAIENLVIKNFPEDEKKYIRDSWNITNVQFLQVKNQNLMYPLLDALKTSNRNDQENYIKTCKLITWHAIRTHPAEFMKFTIIQMIHYFDGFYYKNITAFPTLVDYKTCFTARLQRYFHEDANTSGRFFLFKSPKLSPDQATAILNSLNDNPWHRINQ